MSSSSISTLSNAQSVRSNPLRELAQLAIQIQTGSQDLTSYELVLGDANISYVQIGAAQILQTVHNLMRASITTDTNVNPLFTRDVRHNLRNQIAVVKGFSDLMKMDLPENHPAQSKLSRIGDRAMQFVEVLDFIKETAENAQLPMAS